VSNAKRSVEPLTGGQIQVLANPLRRPSLPHPLIPLAASAGYVQPSSRMAQPAFHIFVMCRIFPSSNCMT
jgi:hypothetical protein